jgi:16S rRNA (cytosine1402-N4)-methyltransferase
MAVPGQTGSTFPHTPVLLREVLDAITPRDGAIYVDATFGAGGYSRAILEAAECTVWGIDRDPEAQHRAADVIGHFPGRLSVLQGCYGGMVELLKGVGVTQVDGIAFDLGVSSMQLDDASRGFSFRADGPLDMRMSRDGMSAADVVNALPEKDLANVIYKYGEERASRRIAKTIIEVRAEKPITSTAELARLIRGVVRKSKDGIDPATRTFQALRIFVNDELEDLERGLRMAETLLAPGGKMAVVSFHSLEDKIVKCFLRDRSGSAARPSRHLPVSVNDQRAPTIRLVHRGLVKPSFDEVLTNPRARSARLRVGERTNAPIWPSPNDDLASGRAA